MAKSQLFEINTVTHKHDLIHFTWTDIGGVYYVYRNDELLYEGTAAEFRDGDFKHAKLYNYSIERAENDVVVDVIRLQTSAFAEQLNVENPLQSLIMTTIVGKSQIALSWEKIKDVTHYEIYRNDIFIKEVQTNQYIDRDITPNEEYTYRIQSKRPLEKSEESFSKMKSLTAKIAGIMNEANSRREPEIERFSVIKKIGRPRDLLVPVLERKMKRQQKTELWKFRYSTFLADKMIKNPNFFSKCQYFQGDDRGFQVDGKSFRTRVDIMLDYRQPRSPMYCTKEVGKTVAYDYLGKFLKEAVAPSDGIELTRSDHKIGEAGFLLTHQVQNPLVSAPSIDYEVQAVLRRDGTFDITGFHNQAPHHEIYLSCGEEGEWLPIHLAESNGLIWMSNIMSWHYWRCLNFE